MATGTISAQEIGNGSGPVTLTKQNAAKHFSVFNGVGTIASTNSLNESSLVDNGTGDYTSNLTSGLSTGGCYTCGHFQQVSSTEILRFTAYSASSARVQNVNSGASLVDTAYVAITGQGDLAT